MLLCEVRQNCQHAYECDFCMPGYRDYQPINVHILSPAQLSRREGKKASEAERKKSEASKRGKKNRQSGKRAEKELLERMKKLGFDVKKVALSGALAGKDMVGGAKAYDGDLHWFLFDEEYLIESKYGKQCDFVYKKANDSGLPVWVGDYCLMLDETNLTYWLNTGNLLDNGISIPDTNKVLHDFFDQDNADIVVCKSPNAYRIFLIRKELVEKWHTMIPSTKKSETSLPSLTKPTRKEPSVLPKKRQSQKNTTRKTSTNTAGKSPGSSTISPGRTRRFPSRKARTTSPKETA